MVIDPLLAGEDRLALTQYLLEDSTSQPFPHLSQPRLDSFDLDGDDGFAWCEFRRIVEPEEVYDLDLTRKLYHFFFWGSLDDDERPIVGDNRPFGGGRSSKVHRSGRRMAIDDAYNDVVFDPLSSKLLAPEIGFLGRGGGASKTISAGVFSATFIIGNIIF